jgi:hypothetical protein
MHQKFFTAQIGTSALQLWLQIVLLPVSCFLSAFRSTGKPFPQDNSLAFPFRSRTDYDRKIIPFF